MVESNRKNESVKRNLIRQDAFQNPISFFHNHFIKIQASPQLFLTYVCFPFYRKELFQEDKKSFYKVLISIFVKLRVLNEECLTLKLAPVDDVAFFVYFSSTIPAASSNHILAFEKVITNVGHAYHHHSGTFIALRSNLYVYTWTIRQYGQRRHSTELLVK